VLDLTFLGPGVSDALKIFLSEHFRGNIAVYSKLAPEQPKDDKRLAEEVFVPDIKAAVLYLWPVTKPTATSL
jgi:hypothetical protein